MVVVSLCLVLIPDIHRIIGTFKLTKPTTKYANRIVEGMKVSHAKFGVGIVKEKIGPTVFRVTFEDHGTMDIHHTFLSLI